MSIFRSLTSTPARRTLWVAACCLLSVALAVILLVMAAAWSMQTATADNILTEDILPDDLGAAYDGIVVLGAGLKDDGTPSDMLADRVTVACRLYAQAGSIPIIMSGDHSGDYNEVSAMKELAVSLGVDSEDIFLDHQGYSTYESIYRAKAVFGAERILIVTQAYHLHRALFIAEHLGMDADGVSADLRPYRKKELRHLREYLARYKDMYLTLRGDPIGDVDASVDLSGNGDDT